MSDEAIQAAIDETEIESEDEVQAEDVKSKPAPDSEEAILERADSLTLDNAFGGKSEREQVLLRQFAELSRETHDPSGKCAGMVQLGYLWNQIADEERKHAPGSYSRSSVSKIAEQAARLAGTPESENRPDEYAKAYAFAQLVRSTPGENEGDPRTIDRGPIPSDWFGQIRWAHLREFFPTVERLGGDNDVEQWEFKAGWEAWVRDMIKRTQDGLLSVAGIKALYVAKKRAMDKAAKEERDKGKSKDEIKAEEDIRATQDRQDKLAKTRKHGVELLEKIKNVDGFTKADLRDLLIDSQVIPAEPKVNSASIKGFAMVMKPGDAKLLIQELATLANAGNENARKCLGTIMQTATAVMKSVTNTQANTVPLRKTGS